MKKLLIAILSLLLVTCTAGLFIVASAEETTTEPVVLTLDYSLTAGENQFRVKASPSLYVNATEGEYDIPGASLNGVELFNGTDTATVTHFRNEPNSGSLLFYNTNRFMAFNTASAGCTVTFKANTTFVDHDTTYTFGNKDIVYVCRGSGVWTREIGAEEYTLLTAPDTIEAGVNQFRLAVSPLLYKADGVVEYDVPGAPLSAVEIFNGTSTANVTHFRVEPATGKLLFYNTNNFLNFASATEGCTITIKAGTTFVDHVNFYTFGNKDVVYECTGDGVWTKKDESELPEKYTTSLLKQSEVNVPSYGDNSVSFDNDKIAFNLTKDTAQSVSSYDATVALNGIYGGDFTAEFNVSDKSQGHTGDRFLIISVGEAVSFMYLPYQNDNVYLLSGANYDAGLSNSLYKKAIAGDLNVKFVRVGNQLTLYVNGEQFGESQAYTSKNATFTVKARRLVAEVSDISVLGTHGEAPATKVWTTEDYADSVINVPEYESNSVTAIDDKLSINLSNTADPGDLSKQATVSFNKKYADDFTLEFGIDYKSTSYAQQRYLMITLGNSYSIVCLPSSEQVHLIGGTDFNTSATFVHMSDAELSSATFKVVRAGNNMTFYINGSQFGTTQSYTEETVSIGVKAHRVVADITGVTVTSTEYTEPAEEYVYWTSADFANSVINIPSYGDNAITTDGDKVRVDLSKDVTADDFSYQASVVFKKQYKGDFVLKYTIDYLSTSNTGHRYIMVTVGDSYALLLCPYNADVQLLASTTYDSRRQASVTMNDNTAEYTVKRVGDLLYFYVNDAQLGEAQTYTDELVTFGIKAHRVTAEITDFRISGEEYIAPVDPDAGKVFVNWTSKDYADSVINVPAYGENAVTTTNDKLNVSLSADTDANTDAYDASVVFGKKYDGDYTIEFTMEYLSVTHTNLRYLSFVAGEYTLTYCPYCEKLHVYKGEGYHVGENLVKEIEFKNVTEFRFRIVAEGSKITVKVNDTDVGDFEKKESVTEFAVKARRTIFEIRDLKIAGSTVVSPYEASTDVLRIVSATGTKTPAMIINRNLGSNAFALENVNKDAVSYVTASGETKTLKSVNYSLNSASDLTPALLFRFDGEPTENDVLTVKAGFSFDLNGETVSLPTAYKAVYTNGGWNTYYIRHGEVTVKAGTATVGSVSSPDSVLVDFGIKGVAGGATYIVDGTSGWYNYDNTRAGARIFDMFENHADYVSEGKRVSVRYALVKGVFAFVGIANVKTGDTIILRKGLTVYEGNEAKLDHNACIIFEETSYAPVFVLNENLVFVYDGEKFVSGTPATSVTITNEEELGSLTVGRETQIKWSINNGANDYPKFISSDNEVATVDVNGNVVALKEGEVTFTLRFADVEESVTITVGRAIEKTGIDYNLKAYAEKDGKKYIVAYLGEDFNVTSAIKNIVANWIYGDGEKGSAFDVTADMIKLDKFDNTKVGETFITVETEGVSVDIAVYVYEVATVDDITPSRISPWNNAINLYFADNVGGQDVVDVRSVNVIEHPEYGISENMVTLRTPALDGSVKYAFHTIGQVTNLQCIMFFNGFDASNTKNITVGTVLSLGKDFRFYRYVDGTFVASYKFKGAVSYVWTGTEWAYFEADASSVEIDKTTITLPIGGIYEPEYSVLPEGAYYKPVIQTDGDGVIAIENGNVKAISAGEAKVYIVYGTRRTEVSITVVEKEIQGVVVVNDRTFNVSAGGTLDISKIKIRADYGDDVYGEEMPLTDEIATYSLDTTKTGRQTLAITVTLDGKDFDVTVNVAVWAVEEVYPDNIACLDDDGWFMGNAIGIFFQKTFNNMANVYPTDLPEADGAKMRDYVEFRRNNTALTIKGHGFLTYIYTITPYIGDNAVSKYEVGDTVILKNGMCFYKWFGDVDANNVPVGDGDYVKVGELKYDMSFTYNENHKFYLVIPAVDAKLVDAEVSVGLGETHGTNVVVVPSYASDVEWFFSSDKEDTVSVTADGLLKGLKIGTATITATLKKINGETVKTLTFNVTVKDSVAGIKITSDKKITVKKGWQFDYSELKTKFGIKANVLMSSGALGKEVSLDDARVTGYDPEKTGEQTLTFRISVDGKSVTGELTLTVESKGGCKGTVGYGSVILLVSVTAVAIILKKKGRNNA